jgi:hypothetical protein
MLLAIFVIAVVILVIILMTGQKSGYKIAKVNDGKEEFGDVLGALGPYQAQLAASDDQIRQTDPSLRLQPNNAWNAGLYNRSVFTDMRKAGVPPEEPVTITSKCKKQCASNDPLASQKCTGLCSCHENAKVWCTIQCKYQDHEPLSDCVRGCMKTKVTNCNQFNWVFFDH